MKKLIKQLVVLVSAALLIAACGSDPKETAARSEASSAMAVENTVTLVDLGSMHCKPCIMMMPILDTLEKEYEGRAVVKFVDVNKYPEEARRLGVMTIPTQIIYDRQGKEVLRHVGFFPQDELKQEIDKVLQE